MPPPTIRIISSAEIASPETLARIMAEQQQRQSEWAAKREAQQRAQATEEAKRRPPPTRALVDQIRDLLATLPPAQKERISLPMILPFLQGKYRDRPHYIQVASAMRVLGYTQVRSYTKADGGTGKRYWVKENHNG